MSAGGQEALLTPGGPNPSKAGALKMEGVMARAGYLSMGAIVRPFTQIVSKEKLRTIPGIADEEPEAFVEWGEAAEFTQNEFRDDASRFATTKPDDPDTPEIEVSYSTQAKSWNNVDYVNPGDTSQVVRVQEQTQVEYKPPDRQHETYIFHLAPPGQPV